MTPPVDHEAPGGAAWDTTEPSLDGLSPGAAALYRGIRQRLLQRGLSWCIPFPVTPRVRAIFPFADLDQACPLALLVANDARLWAPFEAARAALPSSHPLDAYVLHALKEAIDEPLMQEPAAPDASRRAGVRTVSYLGWRMDYPRADGTLGAVPLQRVAEEAGFAALGPAHLSAHPLLGPWLAFRAVVILGVDASLLAPPMPQRNPCESCATQPCRGAVETALAHPRTDPNVWQSWVAVRDACPVGAAFRYSDSQIRYHYTRAFGSAAKP